MLGELLEEFSPLVPTHHATRFCTTQGATRYTTLESMREATLFGELRRYPMHYSVIRTQGISVPRSATLTPQPRECAACGKPFFAYLRTHHCSRTCASVHGKHMRRHERRAAPQPERMTKMLKKIERAIDELEQLKDDLLRVVVAE